MCHTASFDLTLQSLILLWYCSMLWEEEPSVATTLPSPAAVPASPPEWIWPWLSYFRLFPLWGKWSMGGVWCYSLHGSIQLNYLETWFTVHSICWFRVCYMVSEYICDTVVKGCVYEEYGVQGRTGQGLLFHRSFFGWGFLWPPGNTRVIYDQRLYKLTIDRAVTVIAQPYTLSVLITSPEGVWRRRAHKFRIRVRIYGILNWLSSWWLLWICLFNILPPWIFKLI